jgi:hypothetical protein
MLFTCLLSHSFGVIHAMGMLAVSFYGWVPVVCTLTTTITTAWDAVYLATFAAIPLSWLVCRDKCLLSIWWKKMNMAPGNFDDDKDDDDDDDITMALLGTGLSRETVDISLFVVQAARVISVWSVHMRSVQLLPGWLVLPTLVLYLVYVDDIAAKRWGRWWQPWLHIALGGALMLWETKLLFMWW